MDQLRTADEVIDALGGTSAAARVTGRGPRAVSNWRKRGRLAAGTFVVVSERLKELGKSAPAELWGISAPEQSGAS